MSVIKNSGLISVGTLLSKIFGFLREVVMALVFGASRLTDAYLVAQVVPSLLFSLVGSSLSTIIVPLITEYEHTKGRNYALAFANAITTIVLLITILLTVIGIIITPWLIALIAPGFEEEAKKLACRLSRIMFPMIIFWGFAGIATGLLHSQKRFFYPAFMGLPFNIVIISSVLILGRRWGIEGLAWGTVAAVAAQWLFQVLDVRKCGYHFRVLLKHPGINRVGKLILPVLIGSGAAQLGIVVDRILASGLVEGSIAALNFASRLNELALGLFSTAVASALYPELAQKATGGERESFRRLLANSLLGLAWLMVPIAVGIIVLREPLVRLTFERGAFDARATELTAYALFFFALGIPATALRDIVVRGFYAVQDTMTPMWIGIATVGANIALNLILVRYLALGGLALGTSVSVTAGFFILLWRLRLKLGHLNGKLLVSDGSKILVSSALMGVIATKLASWVLPRFGDIPSIIAVATVGCLIYFLSCRLLNIGIYLVMVNRVKALALKIR